MNFRWLKENLRKRKIELGQWINPDDQSLLNQDYTKLER